MKLMTFYRLSVFASVLFVVLALILLFSPAQMLASCGVELTTSTALLAKRIAALYTGVAIMFFMARNVPPSIARSALTYGIMTSCILLAVFGLYEFLAGHATKGILAGAIIELTLALAFIYVNTREK